MRGSRQGRRRGARRRTRDSRTGDGPGAAGGGGHRPRLDLRGGHGGSRDESGGRAYWRSGWARGAPPCSSTIPHWWIWWDEMGIDAIISPRVLAIGLTLRQNIRGGRVRSVAQLLEDRIEIVEIEAAKGSQTDRVGRSPKCQGAARRAGGGGAPRGARLLVPRGGDQRRVGGSRAVHHDDRRTPPSSPTSSRRLKSARQSRATRFRVAAQRRMRGPGRRVELRCRIAPRIMPAPRAVPRRRSIRASALPPAASRFSWVRRCDLRHLAGISSLDEMVSFSRRSSSSSASLRASTRPAAGSPLPPPASRNGRAAPGPAAWAADNRRDNSASTSHAATRPAARRRTERFPLAMRIPLRRRSVSISAPEERKPLTSGPLELRGTPPRIPRSTRIPGSSVGRASGC